MEDEDVELGLLQHVKDEVKMIFIAYMDHWAKTFIASGFDYLPSVII